ncbi:pilus assembly PilX family protein [Legionella steigerwaltii]|nr:pilus assembly protein [Legionella steigerwaltii]
MDKQSSLQELSRKNVIVNEKGYILLLTMVLLIMLTVLALTDVSLNTTQTRIAANATDSEISLEKTEGALNEAINNLLNGTYNANDFLKNSTGLYLLTPGNPPLWTTVNWSSSTSVIPSFQGYSNSQASYIIEQLPSVIQPGQNMKTPTYVYRVTARSLGANGNTSVILQSTVQIQP